MKQNLKSFLALIVCFIMVITILTACGKSGKDDATTTTGVTWGQEGSYQPVQVGAAEMEDIIESALGDESDENRNLGDLSSEEYSKVVDYAKDNGYIVEEGQNQGDTVIKKDQNKMTTAVNTTTATTKKGETTATTKKGETTATTKKGDTTATTKKDDTTATTKKGGTTANGKNPNPTSGKNNATAATVTAYSRNTTEGASLAVNTSAIDKTKSNTFGNDTNTNFVGSVMTNDGGVIAVGSSMCDKNGKAINHTSGVVVKFDKDGSKVWSNYVAGDDAVSFQDAAVLSDGSIIVVGYAIASDVADDSAYKCKDTVEGIICKYGNDGTLKWTKMFGGSGGEIIYAVAALPDGGFMIGGKSNSSDGDLSGVGTSEIKAFVAKYGSDGKRAWTKALSGSKHCAVFDIAVTSDGSAYLAIESVNKDGDYASLDGSQNGRKYAVVARINKDGGWNWAKGIWESGQVVLQHIVVGNDGGCVLAGYYATGSSGQTTGSFAGLYNGGIPGTYDGVVVKYNASGEQTWKTSFIGYENDYITDIVAINGGYAICGYTTSTNRDFQFPNQGEYDSFVYTISNGGGHQNGKQCIAGSGSDRAFTLCRSGSTLYVLGLTTSSDSDFKDVSYKSNGKISAGFITKLTLTQK